VHLVVAKEDFLIEPTTEEIVAAKLAERMDRPLVELEWEPRSSCAPTPRWPSVRPGRPDASMPGSAAGVPGLHRASPEQ
jgi:hypothetical protein